MPLQRVKTILRINNLRTNKTVHFSSIKTLFFYFLFIELVSVLAIQGLGYNCFWDDEAETAIIAKNLITMGHLTGWDGRHLCTNRNGNLLDANLRPHHPFAMYLATAASFRMFGCTTRAGRLPFVIFGLMALFLLFQMLRSAYPSLSVFTHYSVALTALSTSYLLYIRQCRYYALCIFFAMLALAFYRHCLKKPRWVMFAGLGASLTALFFSHYLVMICFAASLLVCHLVFHARQWGKKEYASAALWCALLLLPAVGFSIANKVWIRPDAYTGSLAPLQLLARLCLYFRDFDAFGVLPGIVALTGTACAVRLRKKYLEARIFLEFGLFIAAYITIVSIASPQFVKGEWFQNLADMRYMVVLIPLGAVCTGALLSMIHVKTKPLAFLLFCSITCTNVFSLYWTVSKIRLLLPSYVYEITHDYLTPYEAVINFLDKNPRFMNDTIVCIPEYCQEPIQFYLGDKLRMGGLLDENTTLPSAKVRALPAPLFKDAYFPTLIIAFGWWQAQAEAVRYFVRGKYNYVGGPEMSLPVFAVDVTRPELPVHSFSCIRNISPEKALYFFRRIDAPAH
jgi:hypothetical protein